MLVSRFHIWHGTFLVKKQTHLLWNYFSYSVSLCSLKRSSRASHSSVNFIVIYPEKRSRFTTRRTAILIMSYPPSHITCMSVISYCQTHQNFTSGMSRPCFYLHCSDKSGAIFTCESRIIKVAMGRVIILIFDSMFQM